MALERKHHPGDTVCPTPKKVAYLTKAQAKKTLKKLHNDSERGPRSDLAPYRCCCRMFHIGHKPGTTYKKLKKAGLLTEQQTEQSP
jgi:hypothetical protein